MAYDNTRSEGRRDDKPKEVHAAVCAECKKDCTVPFKPTGSKPVTCRDCFAKTRTDSPRGERSGGRSFSGDRGRPNFDRKPSVDYTKQFEGLNFKLDKIIRQLNSLDEQMNPKPEKTRNAPDNTVDHGALKDVIGQVKD